eukprot:6212969-Pleurochrysis_carterae.AAC.3
MKARGQSCARAHKRVPTFLLTRMHVTLVPQPARHRTSQTRTRGGGGLMVKAMHVRAVRARLASSQLRAHVPRPCCCVLATQA